MLEALFCLHDTWYYCWEPPRHWTSYLKAWDGARWRPWKWRFLLIQEIYGLHSVVSHVAQSCTIHPNGCSTITGQSHECFSLFPLGTNYQWTRHYKTSGWLFMLMNRYKLQATYPRPMRFLLLTPSSPATTHWGVLCSLRPGSGHTAALTWQR